MAFPNITDKQQSDIERAANDSAIRIQSFDGKQQQTGETKFQTAYDLNPQGNVGGPSNDAVLQFDNPQRQAGGIIGSHNDKPSRFAEPGKA